MPYFTVLRNTCTPMAMTREPQGLPNTMNTLPSFVMIVSKKKHVDAIANENRVTP